MKAILGRARQYRRMVVSIWASWKSGSLLYLPHPLHHGSLTVGRRAYGRTKEVKTRSDGWNFSRQGVDFERSILWNVQEGLGSIQSKASVRPIFLTIFRTAFRSSAEPQNVPSSKYQALICRPLDPLYDRMERPTCS